MSGSLGSRGGGEGTQSQQPCVEEDYGADGEVMSRQGRR